MNIISFIEKKRELRKKRNLKHQEKFLECYFSALYKENDADKIEIPYFFKAQEMVKDLKNKGLIEDVYKHIKRKGVIHG